MSAKGKGKRPLDEPPEEHDHDGSSSGTDEERPVDADSGSESEMDELQVEFDSVGAMEADFHRIKPLLGQLFRRAEVDLGSITDLIIAQPQVGAVIKTAPDESAATAQVSTASGAALPLDETIYAVTTIIDLGAHRAVPGISQMMAWVKSKADAGDGTRARFEAALSSGRVGWLISERFINLPPQLAPPSLRSLVQDMAEASAAGSQFQFDKVLYVSKMYQLPASGNPMDPDNDDVDDSAHASKKQKSAAPQRTYFYPEDEVFESNSELTFTFNLARADKSEMMQSRRVMMMDAAKLNVAVEQIAGLFTISPQQLSALTIE